MTTSELDYPVITIDKKGIVEVRGDEDILTTASSRELSVRWFDGITIVDSKGRAVKVKTATFVCGRGRFWGYTVCLNRIVRIELALDDYVWDMSLDELRKRVSSSWRKFGRATHPDYYGRELRRLGEAQSIRELIERLQPHNDARKFYKTLKKSFVDSGDLGSRVDESNPRKGPGDCP